MFIKLLVINCLNLVYFDRVFVYGQHLYKRSNTMIPVLNFRPKLDQAPDDKKSSYNQKILTLLVDNIKAILGKNTSIPFNITRNPQTSTLYIETTTRLRLYGMKKLELLGDNEYELMYPTKATEEDYYEESDEKSEETSEPMVIDETTDNVGLSVKLMEHNKSPPRTNSNSTRRSCIHCNNVDSEECSDPRNNLVSSVTCQNDFDTCYSQHTPFGIVSRGCFNIYSISSIYVCSHDLCNNKSMSEIPFIFSKKRDWVNNVVELTRSRRLRNSLHFNDLDCLHCEVRMTVEFGDTIDNIKCYEGMAGEVPTQKCKFGEMCAVKSKRNVGYIWRGCIDFPLYNYWFTTCGTDNCNYDAIVSVYDKQ